MELNPEISEILKKMKIDVSEGTLALLGIYFNLDITKACKEETVKAINLTKIFEKDYRNSKAKKFNITWNIPLFKGQEVAFDWVQKEWNIMWNKNLERKAANRDVLASMKEFFRKFPEYRKEDVMRATELYISKTEPEYLKNSNSFIFEGEGGARKSILLGWCEQIRSSGSSDKKIRGIIM